MEDVIAAVSTAKGIGAISIVRLSGEESIDIVNKIFKGKDLTKVKSHTIHYGHIIDKNEVLDEVLVSIFLSPKTFTKENVVEINCHGGIYVTNKILELCVINGARLATPGEFTRRAYLNGRIDLTQAESVMDIIDAKTKSTLRMANYGLRGDIKKLITNYRYKLLTCISKVEVNIDYPEYEDEVQINESVLKPTLSDLITEVDEVIKKSENSLLLKQGINSAIIGKPNVGKSSLLNALLREDKAIVTDIAGTTRDIIEGVVNIGGVVLNLIDTAGVRQTEDIVEKIGVEKSKKIIEQASLIILVFDNSKKLDDIDKELLNLTANKTRIIVVNKSDLDRKIELDLLNDYILVTSFSEDDINRLENKIKEITNIKDLEDSEITYVTSARAIAKLRIAKDRLNDALNGIELGMPIDIVNIDISSAWKALGEIIGEVSSDELINELFANFCLGK